MAPLHKTEILHKSDLGMKGFNKFLTVVSQRPELSRGDIFEAYLNNPHVRILSTKLLSLGGLFLMNLGFDNRFPVTGMRNPRTMIEGDEINVYHAID